MGYARPCSHQLPARLSQTARQEPRLAKTRQATRPQAQRQKQEVVTNRIQKGRIGFAIISIKKNQQSKNGTRNGSDDARQMTAHSNRETHYSNVGSRETATLDPDRVQRVQVSGSHTPQKPSLTAQLSASAPGRGSDAMRRCDSRRRERRATARRLNDAPGALWH